MRGLILFLSLVFTLPAEAIKNSGEASFEERMEVFKDVFAALETGNKRTAANGLITIINDDSEAYFHAEAYAQMAGILEELEFPSSSLIAYKKGLEINANAIPSSISRTISLADNLGDTALLVEIFSANLGLDVDADTRSRMAYLTARQAFQKGDLGPAMGLIQMVNQADPDFPEAQNLKGVIMSLQDRPESALAPFQIATIKGRDALKPQKFQDAVLINTARAYFATENFPQAILHYAQVPRESVYWLDAQFERAWAHFRINDMNGVLGMMHTHNSPFFTDEYYPEGELLRIYSLMLMCKFAEANTQIDAFVLRFTSQQQSLAKIAVMDGTDAFNQLRAKLDRQESNLPDMVTRRFLQEDNFLDTVKSVSAAEEEIQRLTNISGDAFATVATEWMKERIDVLVQTEGVRITSRVQEMADDLQDLLNSTEISKLDILDMETQLLERASMTGKLEEAKRQANRKKRIKRKEFVWDYEGEYWADEVGYYRVSAKSECPASMTNQGE